MQKVDTVKMAEEKLQWGLINPRYTAGPLVAAALLRLGGIEKITGRTGESLVQEWLETMEAIALGRGHKLPAWVQTTVSTRQSLLSVMVSRAANPA